MRVADVGGDAIRCGRDIGQFLFARGEKTWPQQQILGRISGECQFRKRDQLRTSQLRLPHQFAHAFAIARDRADGKVELGEGEAQRGHDAARFVPSPACGGRWPKAGWGLVAASA